MNTNEAPKYTGSVFFVKNIEQSKKFYTDTLGQKIEMDFGRCVGFIGGFSIWDITYAYSMMGLKQTTEHTISHGKVELYFEITDLDALYLKIKNKDIPFVHPLKEQPWGQRCFRIYDPDNHIVEFAEPMPVVIQRYAQQGMSLEMITKKTLMPLEIVRNVLGT